MQANEVPAGLEAQREDEECPEIPARLAAQDDKGCLVLLENRERPEKLENRYTDDSIF